MTKGIKALGNGLYWIRVQPINPANGKRVSREKTIKADNEREALKAKLSFEDEVIEELTNAFKGKKRTQETYKDYCEYWLKHPNGNRRNHVSKRNEGIFKTMIWPIIGSVKMEDLISSHVLYWQSEIQEKKTVDGKQYARQSLQGAWRLLRSSLNQAGVDGRAEKGICEGMRFSPKKGNAAKVKESLTVDDVKKFFVFVDKRSVDIKAMIYLQITIGCRFGEISALEWSDIDFAKGEISINKSQFNGDVNLPKTGEIRPVALLPQAAAVLLEHKAEQERKMEKGLLVKERMANPNLVFPSTNGKYRHPSMMCKTLKQICKEAGINKVMGTHTLRRSFNNLGRTKAEKDVIKSIVGHATDQMFEHYSNIDLEEKRKAQEQAFSGVFPAQPVLPQQSLQD